jgi:hypothetical protein
MNKEYQSTKGQRQTTNSPPSSFFLCFSSSDYSFKVTLFDSKKKASKKPDPGSG